MSDSAIMLRSFIMSFAVFHVLKVMVVMTLISTGEPVTEQGADSVTLNLRSDFHARNPPDMCAVSVIKRYAWTGLCLLERKSREENILEIRVF